MYRLLVTGSSGLIGSEVVSHFCTLGWRVHGIDNNMRADFFGPEGDTRWNQCRLTETYTTFTHHELDVRNRAELLRVVAEIRPDLIVHAAAQPSHDLAAERPFDDFDVNAVGTINALEATHLYVPEAVFVFLSTNKVYGDKPNELSLREMPTRWDYANTADWNGIRETLSTDQSKHSVFGSSKLAADSMVQEYGRYFGMRTCCLRGGCLTGPAHSGVKLHGFLSYLIKCNVEGRLYTVFGYKGKQVRDNIHSYDVARFIEEFWKAPRCAEVYNLGGGRDNSTSILEAFEVAAAVSGRKQQFEYVDEPRAGDHICYISDLNKCRSHYPHWEITIQLTQIFEEIYKSWQRQRKLR
jgi:CDP-paratose 2-epimerase